LTGFFVGLGEAFVDDDDDDDDGERFFIGSLFLVLWDFDYVLEIVMVNDDDHVDSILDLF